MDSDTGSAGVNRELDDTVEIPALTDLLADALADADDGPQCGSAEAVTRIWVSYMPQSGGHVHIDSGEFCCARHVPPEAQKIPGGAEMMDVVIQDGLVQTTILADGTTTVLVNWDYMLGDTATFPPAWPNGKNVLELADFITVIRTPD